MLKGGRELMWIVFWGGVFTLFAGLITGGIFGDLLRSEDPFLNLPMLAALREKMLWFDSMREPMVFFRLVLLLGLIQVVVGLIMGFFGDLRQGKIVDAMVDKGTWLVILGSLVTILFASDMCVKLSLVTSGAPPMDSSVIKPAFWLTLLMALVVVGFGARDEKSLFFRFFIGFLKLIVLGGVFSYLGDILSYVRVMALGMVTAGIGMAVNTIAFMMYDIPGVGILLTIAVLTAGHLFNLAINLLGGFVHTLRLQYVEFFSKFFIGGGRAFRPLAYSEKYAKIIE
jgi:V/A-type H+-transporting ATPase subunit I